MPIRADDVASVIVSRSGSFLTAMQLQKLLYYVQAWHVAVTDEPLFAEQIKAWADGPVVPQVWHSRKAPDTRTAGQQPPQALGLDDLTSDLIDLVLSTYGSMSGDELSALTHAEVPWRDARGDLPDNAPSSEVVSLGAMADFYRSSRKLGGRTAADLAAGGVHLRAGGEPAETFDMDAFLSSLGDEYSEFGPDDFGGGNLERSIGSAHEGIETERRRAYQSA